MQAFDWEFPYPSQRMPILARNVVATSQPLAAQAGLRMLMKGGSAVDAVVVTDATPSNTTYHAAVAAATTAGTVSAPANGAAGTVQATIGTLSAAQSAVIRRFAAVT